MPHPTSPYAYPDIRHAFDLALANRGARRVCASREEAAQWRHRAHKFRATLRAPINGIIPPTPYDNLVLRITPEEPHIVIIAITPQMVDLETLDGRVIDAAAPPPSTPLGDDPLSTEAIALARSLGIEL